MREFKRNNLPQDKLDILDTFVITGVLTVLGTRVVLKITGFPQIGGDSLHIAHVLWGGLFMLVALMLVMLVDKVNKILIAFLGGIGFGLFIDEVGKFITQDNNYFYEPSIMIMYIIFLCIWLLTRLIIVKAEKREFMSPAVWPKNPIFINGIIFWVIAQAVGALILLFFALRDGFEDITGFFDADLLGVVSGSIYTVALVVGLYRLYRKNYDSAAHIIRGAIIFAILAMYPFIFFRYPQAGTIGIILTAPVILGLSELSLKDVFGSTYSLLLDFRSSVLKK